MRLNSGYETKKARVEMLPLIDVVFLLLVFFIYAIASMVVHRGIRVDLPNTGTAAMVSDDYISITIDSDNQLYLNGAPAQLETLAGRVLALRQISALPVFIEGDQKAYFGLAIELLDHLKQVGVEEISFSCEKQIP